MAVSSSGRSAPADAELATRLLDNSYIFGNHGFLYTSTRLPAATTLRHPAVLLFSVDHSPFQLTLPDGSLLVVAAALVPPRVERTLNALGAPIVSINILPTHAAFHVFRATQQAGVRQIDRHTFNHLDDEFERLLHGRASVVDAELCFSSAVTEAQRLLPPAPAPDPRALSLIRMLDADPDLTLNELAQRLGYSHQVMARVFSSAVGMSLRDYQNWLKQRRVFDVLYTQRSLTEVAYMAGFADSPQFTRTYQRWFGNTPSHARDPKQVRVFTHRSLPALPAQDEG